MNNTVLLSTAYLPPIQYFTKILLYENVLLEQHEHYSKQTYRNRCAILGANGPVTLSVPVEKEHNKKMLIREAKIDYATPWQKLHWRAIGSAYGRTPFFLYFKDDLAPFYTKKETFLFDYNLSLINTLLGIIGIKKEIGTTAEFFDNDPGADDFRSSIHPKQRMQKDDPHFIPSEYYQVFSSKHGFQPNLSILDLLFNEGNESLAVMKRSIAVK